jgi:hypothetical protein
VYSEHNKLLKETYHSIKYKQHLASSNGWDTETIESMWWEPLDKALNKLPAGNKTTLHKFIHKRLPCNKRENLYYPYLSENCKVCSDTTECQYHVIQCNNCGKRIEARNTYIKRLKHMLEQERTNNTTIMVIIHYVEAWLTKQPSTRINILAPEASAELKKAVISQSKLGWEQFFCGRLAKKWSKVYQHDLDTIDTGLFRPTTIKWGTKIVEMNYDLVLQCWGIRNDLEYNDDDEESETTKKKKLVRKNTMEHTKN